ncbi:MAG: prepilin peptidase, partial [bacterium]|nr:prepilin peptidase [bacterium]
RRRRFSLYCQYMTAFLTVLVGLCLGSFANVLIDRIPAGKSIRGRSACDRCRRTLRWWELVPVVSAVVLRHRCPTCDGVFSARNTAVELGAAAVLLVVLWRHGGAVTSGGVVEAFGLLALLVLAVIDLRDGIVPDQISLPAIGTVLAVKALFIIHYSLFISQLLIPIVMGAGWFAVQRWMSKGRWVGDGDTRVGALMGAMFAPMQLIVALASSYIVGGAIAGVLLLMRRVGRGSRIPLVPFLFVGSAVAMVFGDRILAWYGW